MSNAPAAGDGPGIGPSRRFPAALVARRLLRLSPSVSAPRCRRGQQIGMHMIVLNLVLIGLVITLEPIPLTAFILVLASKGGVRKGAAFIFGWLLSLAIVIAFTVLVTGNNPPKPSTAPSLAALAAKLAIGVGLTMIAIRHYRKMGKPKPPKKPPRWQTGIDNMTPWYAIGLGPLTQPWALVAAGVTVIVEAKLASWQSLPCARAVLRHRHIRVPGHGDLRRVPPPASAALPGPVAALDRYPYRPGHHHRVPGTRLLADREQHLLHRHLLRSSAVPGENAATHHGSQPTPFHLDRCSCPMTR